MPFMMLDSNQDGFIDPGDIWRAFSRLKETDYTLVKDLYLIQKKMDDKKDGKSIIPEPLSVRKATLKPTDNEEFVQA